MKYIIIGNSAAGIGGVEGIRKIDKDGEITVISNEPYHTYSRPLISYLLQGKATEETMKYRGNEFYRENNCTLLFGKAVTKINAADKTVVMDDGKFLPYDQLLVAAGSSAFIPPIEGLNTVKSVYTFMCLDDAKAIAEELDEGKRVLIIGAGLIGLKCAEGLYGRAAQIEVVDFAPRILSAILDYDSAKLAQTWIEDKGIGFHLSESVTRFEKNMAFLQSGGTIEFDILIIASGVRPNVGLLADIADIDKGIIINEKSETSVLGIYAAGDCTQSIDVSSGESRIMALLPNAYMQGECAGINMAGGEKTFDKAIPMNAIGFFGLQIISAGNYVGDVYENSCTGTYKKLFYSGNKLNGYILVGSVEKAGIYTSLIRDQIPLDSIDFELVCEKPGLMAFTKEERAIKLG